MRQYELTYLISDSVPESNLNKVTGKVSGFATDLGGKIVKEEIWKRRKLAYLIKKQAFATYATVNLELPREKINEFERQLRLTAQIIRHLLIIKDQGEETRTLTADEIVDTEAIEQAIGGEKSFEAIEGETEESRDLMAVRESSEEEKKIEEAEKVKEDKEDQEPTEQKPDKQEKEAAKKKGTGSAKKAETKKETEKPKKTRKKPAAENEADRLAKLDEKLDEILKDDL